MNTKIISPKGVVANKCCASCKHRNRLTDPATCLVGGDSSPCDKYEMGTFFVKEGYVELKEESEVQK
jgi:hypothetical protein